MRAIADYIEPDLYGETTVCSIYYDTPDYRLIRRSLEKPVYKEKLRLRSYGQATPQSDVFLEMKKKYNGVVYKRRLVLHEEDAVAYMNGERPLPTQTQIGRELDRFCTFYGKLQPTVCLCYERAAFVSKQQSDLRITFDRNIRWRNEGMRLTEPTVGQLLLPEDTVLMEIKTASAIPLWLLHAMEPLQIKRSSFSKYGTVYKNFIRNHA
jgi:SPX domain protein involved in polyphosphate accumulation